MNMLEEALDEKKEELNRIEAPAEIETLLRQALINRKRRWSFKPVAAAVIALLLFTYSFDTLAYYGKKFTGYDQTTMGSLKQLNEEGRGQGIGQSRTFSNGVEVTIDGIMFDENELVAFYKVHSSDGKLQDILNYNLPRLRVFGIKPMGYFNKGGHGVTVDDQTMTFLDTLEPPQFYEKWMRFDIEMVINKQVEVQSIRFTLDRNKAMKRTARMDLNAEARLGEYRILFDRLTASTMSSVLEGRIIPLTDAALKVFKAETAEASMEIPQLSFDVVSDLGEVSPFYGGQSVSGNDIRFSNRSDALPKDFKTLQIRNIRLDTMKLIDKTVDIGLGSKDLYIDDDLTIKRVYQDEGDTCIAVLSRGIPVIGFFEGKNQLDQINLKEFEHEAESSKPVLRVYRFKAAKGQLELSIKYIRYSKYSADTINISVE